MMDVSVPQTFHERQRLMQCAAHAINNLLQEAAVDASDLDAIALDLGGRWTLAHRWPFLGNHDANVVFLALQQHGLDAQWWDARRTDLEEALDGANVVGALLNARSWLGLLPGRHWVALRRTTRSPGGEWLNLDSKLNAPRPMTRDEAAAWCRQCLAERGGQLILVVKGEGTSHEHGSPTATSG